MRLRPAKASAVTVARKWSPVPVVSSTSTSLRREGGLDALLDFLRGGHLAS